MPSPRAGGFRWRRDPPPPATPHIRARAFGGLDHAGDVAETLHRLRTLAPAIQPVVELCRSRAPTPAHIRRIEFDPAHALYASSEHDVAGAGLHHHRRSGDRLKAAAATAIGLEARHFDRQPRLERDPASDARGFAVGVGLSECDVFNPSRIEAGAFQHCPGHDAAEGLDGHFPQGAAKSADRRAYGTDDRCAAHQ